jgi:hypothetical protein
VKAGKKQQKNEQKGDDFESETLTLRVRYPLSSIDRRTSSSELSRLMQATP